jgi:CheY-like chemotaxis protein
MDRAPATCASTGNDLYDRGVGAGGDEAVVEDDGTLPFRLGRSVNPRHPVRVLGETTPENAVTRPRPGVRRSVLVIEDDASLLATFTRYVKGIGYDAIPCASAEAGVKAAMVLRAPPLAVVADVRLTGGADGIHAVARIRELFGQVPALIMTGQALLESEAFERLQQLGAGVRMTR